MDDSQISGSMDISTQYTLRRQDVMTDPILCGNCLLVRHRSKQSEVNTSKKSTLPRTMPAFAHCQNRYLVLLRQITEDPKECFTWHSACPTILAQGNCAQVVESAQCVRMSMPSRARKLTVDLRQTHRRTKRRLGPFIERKFNYDM